MCIETNAARGERADPEERRLLRWPGSKQLFTRGPAGAQTAERVARPAACVTRPAVELRASLRLHFLRLFRTFPF